MGWLFRLIARYANETLVWLPVGANQSQRPAPLGRRTVFNRFGCVLLFGAKNLIDFSSHSTLISSDCWPVGRLAAR
jgi:hypothetical protein